MSSKRIAARSSSIVILALFRDAVGKAGASLRGFDPEAAPTVIQSSLETCSCTGSPHDGRKVEDLQCLAWNAEATCGAVALNQWSDKTACSWVGCSSCVQSPCPLEPTGFNWIIGTDLDSECTLQYVGAYQFDSVSNKFQRVDSSSFNVMGSFDAQDLNPGNLASQLADGKMWLPPYPGGAAEWVAGFTPYDTMDRYKNSSGVLALGGPAFMVVAKFKGRLSHMTWYVLNQRTLIDGADDSHGCVNPTCTPSGNCWGCGYGEVDILEGNYCEPNLCMTLSNGDYEGGGSCLYGDTSRLNVWNPDTDGEDPLIAAVFDSGGVTVYINPTWEGLSENQANPQLNARPTKAQKVVKAPPSERGMWKDLMDTNQLEATSPMSPSAVSPLKPRQQLCAAPGWDVNDADLYFVKTPAPCCRGHLPVNTTGTLRCPGGAAPPTSR